MRIKSFTYTSKRMETYNNRWLLGVWTVLMFFLLMIAPVIAADQPRYILYPTDASKVDLDSEFTLDILIDTNGEEIVEAKAILEFDPSYLEVVEAQRVREMFCQWPDDENLVDNQQGVIKLDGFCQTSPLYKTVGDPDVFARIKFKSLKGGSTTLRWKYLSNGSETAMLKQGSPPENILTSSPEDKVINIEDDSTVSTPTSQQTSLPSTALFVDDSTETLLIIVIGAIVTISGGLWLYLLYKQEQLKSASIIVKLGNNGE